MEGLMMDYSLTLEKILWRSHKLFPQNEIVSKLADGSLHRYTYTDFYKRVLRLMNVLRKLGVKKGDRIATFAWNSYRHMEIYFAVPCLGAVLHTINIRLFPEQLTYIINHAEDKFIFVDKSLVKALIPHQDSLNVVQNYIIMDDNAPDLEETLNSSLDYEILMAEATETEDFPQLDENSAAGLCYTSGTTGNPKGVLYSHRSIFLHTMGLCMADCLKLSFRDSILPVVPMFHVNAWGIPFTCCFTGAKVVYPGSHFLGQSIAELLEKEKVTLAFGVPTIWNLLYQYLKKHPHDLSNLTYLVVGGAAVPQALIESFEKDCNVKVLCAWGMTETSPVGAVCNLKDSIKDWSEEKRNRQLTKQGLPVPLIEVRVVNEEGEDQPWDGKSIGELLVKGPWVASSYYNNDYPQAKAAFTEDGWFRTGDVVTIDELGYIEIKDRKKDLIKISGEWVSSIDMENTIMGHPLVLEATVIGRPDKLRQEMPVVFVVPIAEAKDTLETKVIYEYLSEHFSNWQLPKKSDIHFVESIPKTSVGKFDKKVLRKQILSAT